MKTISIDSHRVSVVLLAAGMAVAATCWAGAAEPSLYVRAGIGPAFTQDAELEQFFGEPVNNNKVKLETGMRFDAAVGYHLTDWFAVEGEIGYIFNTVKSVQGTSDDDLAFSQSPMLVNVVFQLPNKTGFIPFIGGGGGGSVNAIYADSFTLGGTTLDGSEADATYAYQAFGGVRYDFDPRMGVSLAYKYSVTGESSWKSDFGTSGRVRIGGLCTHAVTAAFTYRF